MNSLHFMMFMVALNGYWLTFDSNRYKGLNVTAIAVGLIYIAGKVQA